MVDVAVGAAGDADIAACVGVVVDVVSLCCVHGDVVVVYVYVDVAAAVVIVIVVAVSAVGVNGVVVTDVADAIAGVDDGCICAATST